MKSTADNVTLTIGEAAARFNLAPHVLRHWESVGLLSPGRVGDRRRFDADDMYRIALVIWVKQAGLSLEDIAELCRAEDNAVRKDIIRGHREALRRRIARDRAALELVEHGLACDHEDLLTCPHFRNGVEQVIRPAGAGS